MGNPILKESKTPFGFLTRESTSYNKLMYHLIRGACESGRNSKQVIRGNFLDFFKTDVKSLEKYCNRLTGKQWLRFTKEKNFDSFELLIPQFFWISYPGLSSVLCDWNKTQAVGSNVMSHLFSTLILQIEANFGGRVIHPGSFLTALESTELYMRSEPENRIFDFYYQVYSKFMQGLTEAQVFFIENFYSVFIAFGSKRKPGKIQIDFGLITDFLNKKTTRPTWSEIYFSWLFTTLIQFLTSKEISSLENPQNALLNPNLLNYERERAFQLLICRVKVPSFRYNQIEDFRCLQTGTVIL